MGLKQVFSRIKLRSQLKCFDRAYRWHNAGDIKMGMRVLIRGRVVPMGSRNLATLGRVVMESTRSSDPIGVFQVLTTPGPDYKAFLNEGVKLSESDQMVSDLNRAVNDPTYAHIFPNKRVKTAVVDEAAVVLNNEPLLNAMRTFRDAAMRNVLFPYWNALGTAVIAVRVMQNATMQKSIWPGVIGTYLRGLRYVALSEEAWRSIASDEGGGKSVQDLGAALKVGYLEQVGWIFEGLKDKDRITEIIEYSMFYLGKIKKDIPKDTRRPQEAAQVVAIAGAFDAATHPRPYRKAQKVGDIVQQLEEEFFSGWRISADGTVTDRGKFDPDVWEGFKQTVAPTSQRLGGRA